MIYKTLSHLYTTAKSIREHVLRDLRPYTCTYVDCRIGDQMYDNWRDWATHEQWTHNRIWYCVKHPGETYLTALDFKTHLSQQHQKEPSLNLDVAVAAGATVSSSQDRPCPFCLYVPERGDTMQMQIHIASHLQRVALFALPNSTGLEDGSDAGHGSSKSANAEVQETRANDLEQVVWSDVNENNLIQEVSANPLTAEALENARGLEGASETSATLRESISQFLNTVDTAGSALMAASYSGEKEIVQLLLKRGADPNAPGGEYGSALIAASYSGEKEIVQLLLEHGSEINAQGSKYGSALIAASYSGEKEIVQLLLEHGADINAQGGWYGSALIAASLSGEKEIVQLLLNKGADIDARGGRYSSVLIAALYSGKKEIMQLLLERGANVNIQGGEYGSALTAASCLGEEETVQLLLNKGADIDARGGKYGSALIAASYSGKEEIVRLLLKHGADPNAQGGKYGSALIAASYSGKKEIVQLHYFFIP